MLNTYHIQLVGLVMTAIGLLALAALSTIYGRPLSNEEKLRAGKKSKNIFRLPINFETVISATILLGGIAILIWSSFDLCTFIPYWASNLPDAVMAAIKCR